MRFQNGTLARGQLVEPQGVAAGRQSTVRLGEKAPHLGEQPRPRRLVGEQQVVVAVELYEAANRE